MTITSIPIPLPLKRAATLGTERTPDLALEMPAPSPEGQLLLAVSNAELTVYAQGTDGHDHRVLFDDAPPDNRPAVRELWPLRAMLAQKNHFYQRALPEYLMTLAEYDLRVPDQLLPSLLMLGLRKPFLRPYVMMATGPRARWLASRIGYMDWGWMLQPTPNIATYEAAAHAAIEDALLNGDENSVFTAMHRTNATWDLGFAMAVMTDLRVVFRQGRLAHLQFMMGRVLQLTAFRWPLDDEAIHSAYMMEFQALAETIHGSRYTWYRWTGPNRAVEAIFTFRRQMLESV